MTSKKILRKDTIALDLKGTTKEHIISEMIDILVAAGEIQDQKAALKAIMDREKKMSTGLQNGIAIPHGKMESLEHLVAAVGIKRQGVAFESLDGQPTHIIVMTLSPANRTGPHIQFLADISRTLHDAGTREKVLNAKTEQEVLDALTGESPTIVPS